MNDLELIENYLEGQLSAEERTRFETRLRTEPAVAEALAFYVLAKRTATVEAFDQRPVQNAGDAAAREQRRAELDALRRTMSPAEMSEEQPATRAQPRRGVPMSWVAAASVVLLMGLGWYFFHGSFDNSGGLAGTSATQLVDNYIETNLDTLNTTMEASAPKGPPVGLADPANGTNSAKPSTVRTLQEGVGLYNENKLAEAEAVFDEIVLRQPDNDQALEYAGIVSLRHGNYDKAIDRFHQLSQRTDLVSNPGTFLEAIAYLKRGRPVDKSQAKKLLEGVISNNLTGKNEAKAILDRL